MLKDPNYIPFSAIRQSSPKYPWDDWDPYAPLGKRDEKTMDLLAKLSDRAIISYSIGCAEWVIYSLKNYFDDLTPYLFLESCWAFEMDKGYEAPRPLREEDWKGLVRAPIDLALITILNTYYATQDQGADVEAALSERIALHISEDQASFIDWKSKVLDRFILYYPRSANDIWGPPVPREALDPNIELTAAQQREFVAEFLGSLDPRHNPFLKYTGGDNSL